MRWTKEEIILLKDYVKKKVNFKQIGIILNRSEGCVSTKSKRLGLKKKYTIATYSIERREASRNRMLKENNPVWKGDNVTFKSLHQWVRDNKPWTGICNNCNKKSKKLDAANISGKYLRDINDYKWLCRKCHMKEDGRIEIAKNNILTHHSSNYTRGIKKSKS